MAFNYIPEGTYRQLSIQTTDWGECPTCTITVLKETPHIIKIISNNAWIGYAVYDDRQGKYFGVWEWKQGSGGYYAEEVFECELTFIGKTLTMYVKSRKTGKQHIITYG